MLFAELIYAWGGRCFASLEQVDESKTDLGQVDCWVGEDGKIHLEQSSARDDQQ